MEQSFSDFADWNDYQKKIPTWIALQPWRQRYLLEPRKERYVREVFDGLAGRQQRQVSPSQGPLRNALERALLSIATNSYSHGGSFVELKPGVVVQPGITLNRP